MEEKVAEQEGRKEGGREKRGRKKRREEEGGRRGNTALGPLRYKAAKWRLYFHCFVLLQPRIHTRCLRSRNLQSLCLECLDFFI